MSLALPLLRRQPLSILTRLRQGASLITLPTLPTAFGVGLSLGALRLALPTLQSLLELLPPIVLAVPKKKVSHSRKSMREANKFIKDKLSACLVVSFRAKCLHPSSILRAPRSLACTTDIVACPACGSAKLAHNICPKCFVELTAGWKSAAREAGSSASRR